MTITPLRSVEEILAVLAMGDACADEPGLDVLSHSLQCAALLQRRHPGDPELVAAGLVHDIADAARPGDHDGHEVLGAALVRPVLGDRVAALVAGHVAAKRFLVATEPAYGRRLSGRSTETLAEQGGPLPPAGVERLRAAPDLPALLALRRADEAAKVPGRRPRDVAGWRALLDAVAAAARS